MYFTLNDLIEEFGANSLPKNFDDKQFEQVRKRTERFVDSYLRTAGLSTPVSNVECLDIVRGQMLDIARYYAWSDRPSEQLKERFQQAENWLKDVAVGKIRIVTSTEENKKAGLHSMRLVR